MNIRTISEKVLAQLQNGNSRKDIFNNLVSAHPADAGKIAYCIASVPGNELRNKYIKHNAVLVICFIIYAILNIISGLPIKPNEPTLFLVITTVIPLIMSYFAFQFHGGVYRLAGIWFLIDLLETILIVGVSGNMDAFKLIVLFAIIVLSFLIGRKVFPNLGILGPRKDGSGHYIL